MLRIIYFFLLLNFLAHSGLAKPCSQDSIPCEDLMQLLKEARVQLILGKLESADSSLRILNSSISSLELCEGRATMDLLELNIMRRSWERIEPESFLEGGRAFSLPIPESSIKNDEIEKMKFINDSLLQKNLVLIASLDELRKNKEWKAKGVNFGISFGFNCFFNQQQNFVIGLDSLVHVRGPNRGLSFLLSGVITYRFNEHHTAIINIPLSEFSSNSESAIGLFNKQAAGGIGYGYQLGRVAFIGILNLSPYRKIEIELFEGYKSALPAFTSLPPEDFATSIAYSPSFTIGIAYQLVEGFNIIPKDK